MNILELTAAVRWLMGLRDLQTFGSDRHKSYTKQIKTLNIKIGGLVAKEVVKIENELKQ